MILPEFRLDGQVALIAGAAGERAAAIARGLGEAGATIVVVGREEAPALVAARAGHGKAKTIDLHDPLEVEAAVQEVLRDFGGIDILVTNQEDQPVGPFLETTPADWRQALDANLMAAVYCCQAVGRHMLQRNKGKIVIIGSGLAARGLEGGVAYSVSKAAVTQLVSALGIEWADKGIKVNGIAPVWFRREDEPDAPSDPLVRFIPMKRRGLYSELADMVIFLACDGCGFLTAKTLALDGGVLSHL